MTLFDPIARIRACFADYGARPFLIEAADGRVVTYQEFELGALRAAACLADRGVGPGDRVALLLPNSIEFVTFYFACLFLGAVSVPIAPTSVPHEVNHILERSRARLVVFAQATHSLVLAAESALHRHRLPIRLEGASAQPFEGTETAWSLSGATTPPLPEPFSRTARDAPLILLFTSGTTSKPKGVMRRLDAEFCNAAAFNAIMEVRPDHRFLHVWPMAYSAGFLNTLVSPFLGGASVVLANPFNAQTALTFWKPIIAYGVNALWLSPTMIASLLRIDRDPAGPDYARRALHTVCVGTAPLPPKAKSAFAAAYGVEVFESYGLSELVLITAVSRRHPRPTGTVGRALPGVEIAIADDAGQPLPAGQDGEIMVRTPFAMAGYLDEETPDVSPLDRDRFFPTGDIGQVDADGNLFITGRKKDIILRGGQTISPSTIRDALLDHPAVEDAVVVGIPHDFYGEEIAAALVMKPGTSLDDQRASILSFCRERLNSACLPTRLAAFDRFPLGTTGKVLVRDIRDRIAAGTQ